MDIKQSAEEIDEVDNALDAAEDFVRDGHTNRRCLRCGGELVMHEVGTSYTVWCKLEDRKILTSRGL